MRLPYVPNPPQPADPDEAAVVARIAARRAPRPLQPLDLALLHAPPVADGWNAFLGAIRTRTTLAADLRELAVCRVAVVNAAWYEWAHHAPLAEAAGVSVAGMAAVRLATLPAAGAESESESETETVAATATGTDTSALTPLQWTVLRYADEMTRQVAVSDGTFAQVRALLDERQVVELTAVIACYNCVSRFLVALDVGERNGTGPDATHG